MQLDLFEQVSDATAAGIGLDLRATVRRGFTARGCVSRTIERFIEIHGDVYQSGYLDHQDLVGRTIGADRSMAWSLRQGDDLRLGVGIDRFLPFSYVFLRFLTLFVLNALVNMVRHECSTNANAKAESDRDK